MLKHDIGTPAATSTPTSTPPLKSIHMNHMRVNFVTRLTLLGLRSKPTDSEFESLVLKNPDFSFLEAQEFFISDDAACSTRLKVGSPMEVPVNEEAKRAQLQQRFVVKHIKESLTSMAKTDMGKAKELGEIFVPHSGPTERVPAVELHMFPENFEVNSTWRVLLIPRIQELFGDTFFLCSSKKQPSKPATCIAELPFKPLPFRLKHLVKGWSPSLDPLRTAPHRLGVLGILSVQKKDKFEYKSLNPRMPNMPTCQADPLL